METYTAKTRSIGHRPRSKRLRELGGTVVTSGQAPDLSPYELLSNKVTEVDQNSTDEQYPTAKLLYVIYAALGALIEALDEGKQDAIADLAAIRSGAALGATALQAITAAAGSDIGTVGTPSVTVSTQNDCTTLTFHQLKGAKGDKGDKGDTGATGPQGPAGSNGTNGTTPTIKAAAGANIGSVGTPAVTASTSGTTTTFTFNYLKGAKGDKGDKGDTGATGPTGPQGPQGPAGSNATVTVDSALSSTSTNPVQNKVVNSALAGKVPNTTAGINAAINLLTTGDSDPVDNDYYISQYVNGGTTTTTYHRRPLSKLWNYIKSKADSIYAAVNHTHSGYAASSHTHTAIVGSYTANGGQQPPNYFGKNRVGALMMNTAVNGNSHFKDWLFMDCYSGSDVGGGVAIGVNRQALGAYIMRSAAARTAWAETAELLGTHNWANYCAAKSHTHSYLPLTGGTVAKTNITANSTVLGVSAMCSSPTATMAVYGVKAELDCSGTPPTNTNSAAIYGYAKFGYAGYFNGGVRVTATLTANSVSATTVYQTSDDRLKDYLGDFHFNLADIDRIPLRFFAFKADKERRVLLGTSAQEVQKVLPEIVGSSPADDGEEYLSVDYSKLALVALDCVRQLRDEVATMKAEMAAMRAEIKELKSGR